MLFIYFLLLSPLSVNGVQELGHEFDWYEGRVIFESEDVFSGEILINYQANVLLCNMDGRVKVFPPNKIKSMWYRDTDADRVRFFVTKNVKGKFRNKMDFLEVVLLGEIPVYRKEITRRIAGPEKSEEDYEYYALVDGEYIRLIHFKKRIYPVIAENHKNELKEYAKKNGIKPYKLHGQIQLISYYNSALIEVDHASTKSPLYSLE